MCKGLKRAVKKEKNFINIPKGIYLTAFLVTLLTYWVSVYVGRFFVFVALSLLFFLFVACVRLFFAIFENN